jgi:dipeptidyl aminopeptidase/acylaminoacyl peptidase
MLGVVIQRPCLPQEAHVTPLASFQPKQISHLNEHFLSFPMPKTEVVTWTSTDGKEIEGLLTYPTSYERAKRYPLLLEIHGGPMGVFTEEFVANPAPYPIACFADSGFFILRPNPRGSTGYGKAFRAASVNDWGGEDYHDLMSGVDHLIARGIVNPDQMGVMGWSYGGYMTAWIITQNSQFKAASIGAGITNLISMSGTTDLHCFISDYMGGWENKTLYENRSPIFFVDRIKTPCLIQHGISDLRVPTSQAFEFYHALVRQGKNPVLIIYPDTSHYYEKPQMELQGMEKNLEWFKKHLLNI